MTAKERAELEYRKRAYELASQHVRPRAVARQGPHFLNLYVRSNGLRCGLLASASCRAVLRCAALCAFHIHSEISSANPCSMCGHLHSQSRLPKPVAPPVPKTPYPRSNGTLRRTSTTGT